MKVCNEPGCPELVAAGKCQTHKRERWKRTNASRPSPRDLGYTREWDEVSRLYRATFPRCNRCPNPAEHVHHRDGKGPKTPHGLQWGALEGLCHSCHSKETGKAHGFGSQG